MIAPAPHQSSRATRRLPSGQRSPAGITATGSVFLLLWAKAARAAAFRKQPARRSFPIDAPRRDSSEPLGDGRTSRKPLGASASDDGDSENCPGSELRWLANRA